MKKEEKFQENDKNFRVIYEKNTKDEEISQKDAKKTEKTAEEKAMEHTGASLLELIIGKTFSRHSKLDEKSFLKEIGFGDTEKSEDEVIRIAYTNVLVETTKQILNMKQTIRNVNAILKTCLLKKEEKETK